MSKKVIVVGAGIAGLTAAYRLQTSGYDVTLLEASSRVGGRMSTDRVNGDVIERGAQFLTSKYHTLIPLISELGLSGEIVPTAPYSVVVKDGRPKRFRSDNRLARLLYAASNTRGLGQLVKATIGGTLLLSVTSRRKDDYTLWSETDDVDAALWWHDTFGSESLDYLLEPMFEGFFFHPPEGSSKALAMLIASFNMAEGKVLTLRRGLGSVTEALAERVAVELECPVSEIARMPDGRVRIAANSERIVADYVVLAVPAPLASKLLANQTAAERAVLSTLYASTVVVTLACSKNWSKKVPSLRDVYGYLIPRCERNLVGAIGIEGNKCSEHTNAGELLNIMTEGRQSPALMERSVEEIVALVLEDLESLFPGISSCVDFQQVLRWPYAQTLSPIGRSTAIERYRREIKSSMPVCLAGDFMGIGSTDSAAQTGIRAASAIRATDLGNDA